MNKNTIYIIAGVVLFLAWRNGTMQQAANAQVESAIPRDPYDLGCMWDLLHSEGCNAQPSSNDVTALGGFGFGGVGMSPAGAMC